MFKIPNVLKNLIAKNQPFNSPHSPVSRPMKYPYTLSAKIAQFPYKFYYKNCWVYRFYVYGVIASLPIFIYIEMLSKSPGNRAMWKEIREKELEEYRHKFD